MNHNGWQHGAEIRRLRQRAGLNGRQFAKRIGITSQSLSNIELNNKPAGLTTLIKIATELQTPLDSIVSMDAAEDSREADGAEVAA